MNYHCRCVKCGAEWWQRGTYEPDTNATVLDEGKPGDELHEGECTCGEAIEIFDEEPIDFED